MRSGSQQPIVVANDYPAVPPTPQHVIDSIDGARGDVETATEAMRWSPPESREAPPGGRPGPATA